RPTAMRKGRLRVILSQRYLIAARIATTKLFKNFMTFLLVVVDVVAIVTRPLENGKLSKG
ncbi:MAG: hypothetical protein Q7K16_04190, partial [Candidatus Azambacteria bacterium]|nr:hypothetical protein [Candidatus Azambacteria bacterium]